MIKKISKRFEFLKTQIKFIKYPYKDAIKLIKILATAKFLESVEAHISLNIDPKQTNQQIRTNLTLPFSTGKTKKIAVFTDNIPDSLKSESLIIGVNNILDNLNNGIINFDILITTPQYMPKLFPFSKILGSKGLMPSLKSGTITNDLVKSVEEFAKGKIEYRTDKSGNIHILFGKSNSSEDELASNLFAIYNSIENNKPIGLKGKLFKSFYICTTMSPSVNIDLASFK